ncbi:MAG TPA: SDR family NAD(P)-dependent oxidoreductase [Chloroflexi bacterium]|nr:SDR family NAD(P)-dependent oxidoreductase [Chloroflexota bacterium]
MSVQDTPLSGQVAIVTGAGSGAGATVARALAAAGASVCVCDLNPDRAHRGAEEIVATGGEAFDRQADISNRFQTAALIEAVRDRYERLTVLVHNAHVRPRVPALKMDEWEWRRTIEVNLTGAFFCAQLAGRVMSDEDGGAIFFLIEPIGQATGEPGQAAYAATQSALMGLASALDVELREQGVRVRAIPIWSPEHAAGEVLTLLKK